MLQYNDKVHDNPFLEKKYKSIMFIKRHIQP